MENMNKGITTSNDDSGNSISDCAQTNYTYSNNENEQSSLIQKIKHESIIGRTIYLNKPSSPPSPPPPPPSSTAKISNGYLPVAAPAPTVALPPSSPSSIPDPNPVQAPPSSSSSSSASSPLSTDLSASHLKIPTPGLVDRNNSKGKMKADGNDSSTSTSMSSSSNNNNNNNNRTQAAFVNKLYKMLEDQSIQQLISWSENGDLFSVANPNAFSKLVLPQYFKHNNWQSFVRQLNMYGFHKVNDMIHSNLTSDCQKWEFRHQNFRRGAVEELQNIKRKSAKSHHQYLTAAMPTSSVSTSSMGRLLLGGGHPQQQSSRYQHQHQPGGSRSNKLDDNSINDTSKMEGQPNSIYQHVLRQEDRVSQISQSHETLKNETDDLKILLAKQQTAMQDITDLLYSLTKNDSKISNKEKLENIRQYVSNVYDSINTDTKSGDNIDYEYSSSTKRREKNSGTMATFQSPTAPPPSNPSTRSHSTNLDIDISNSRKSSLHLNNNDAHRNSNSTITSNSSDSNNNQNSNSNSSISIISSNSNSDTGSSSNSNSNCSSDSSGKKDSIPISSILLPSYPPTRKQDDLQQTSATPEKMNLKRLPSIDAVCMGSYRPDQRQHHPHHHQHQLQRPPYLSSSPASTSSTISAPPKLDYDRSVQSLPPLQPMRSYLAGSDSSYQGNTVSAPASSSKEIMPTESNLGTRATSPYLGLGKESALLNPESDHPPPCDYDNSPEPKRKCTEH